MATAALMVTEYEEDDRDRGIATPEQLARIKETRMPFPELGYLGPVGGSRIA